MFRGVVPGLCAFTLALAPLSAFAQAATAAAASEDGAAEDVQAQRPASAADDKEARELFRIGKQAYVEGRFERALKYFKESYELSRRGALLSNIATALDRLRRDEEAVEVYKRYLEQVPEAPNRKLVESRIRIIEAALAKAAAAAPPAAATPATAATASAPPAQAPAADLQAPSAVEAEAGLQPAPDGTDATQPGAPPATEVTAPTPEQTARAAQAPVEPQTAPRSVRDSEPQATPITSRWWFWTGIGAAAAAAVVVGFAASSGGGAQPQGPIVLDPQTRIREL